MTIWNHNQLVWNQAGIVISWCDVCTDFANLINVVVDVTLVSTCYPSNY